MADFGVRTNDILKSIKYSLAKAEVGAYNEDFRKFAEAKSKLSSLLSILGKILMFLAIAGLVIYAFWSAVMVNKSALMPQNLLTILLAVFALALGFIFAGKVYENCVYKPNCITALKSLKQKTFTKLFDSIDGIKEVDFQEKSADRAVDILTNSGLVNLKNASCRLEDVFRFEYKNLPITLRRFAIEGKEGFFTALSFKYPRTIKGIVQLVSNKSNVSGACVKGAHLEANDPDFNKNYKVFATEKSEAGIILAPDFVEWLKKNTENTPGVICISGRLYAVLNNFGMGFELLLTEKTLEAASVLAVNEFIKILDFVDSMQVTENTNI